MNPLFRVLIITASLYFTGAVTLLVSSWLGRWPRLKVQVVRLGEAACTFALGFIGFVVVVLILQALGVPLARRITGDG